jgi:hypothetical protein
MLNLFKEPNRADAFLLHLRTDTDLFSEMLCFLVLVQILRLAPFKRPNRVYVLLPSPEDGHRSSFRNTVFSDS